MSATSTLKQPDAPRAKNRVVIFDTTLRDGEQSPGASMNLEEKIKIALLLEEMGIDIIEAGFPIASNGDFEAVREVAKLVKNSSVAGLSRATRGDIDRAWEALQHAKRPRIHTVIATSPLHMKFKLQMEPEAVHQAVIDSVTHARNLCDDVEWSCEDGSRSEHDFLCRTVESAIKAGARTVNIPDTVGYATPAHMGKVIRTLCERVPNIDKAVVSMHCHDDLGLAVANSLSGVENGAGQIECTINGIGERAGNCSLEEVVMALRTRGDFYQADTRIKSQRLVPTSRLVANITGLQVPRNKAVVGRNAFAHEAGIHQDGMLKERTTYEIMRPEDVGFAKTDLVLGKHSGRAALADRAKALGYHLTPEQLRAVFDAFKILADKKKEVYDGDIAALADQQIHDVRESWSLLSYHVSAGTGQTPSVTLTVEHGGRESTETVSCGDGPVDAIFLAIEKITGVTTVCKDFRVQAVTVGKDAQAEVNVELEYHGRLQRGRGVATDSLEASAKAFLNAINRVVVQKGEPAQPAPAAP
jgi:2-isopropylmalate synthase